MRLLQHEQGFPTGAQSAAFMSTAADKAYERWGISGLSSLARVSEHTRYMVGRECSEVTAQMSEVRIHP